MSDHDEQPDTVPTACPAPGRRRAANAASKPRPRKRRRGDACIPEQPIPRGEAGDAGSIFSTAGELEGFANLFADWWLRRGRQLTSTNNQGGDDA
ncbi:MAG TPA: hypothetical protein VIC06_06935 [Solirubrobacteraceae bacterium]